MGTTARFAPSHFAGRIARDAKQQSQEQGRSWFHGRGPPLVIGVVARRLSCVRPRGGQVFLLKVVRDDGPIHDPTNGTIEAKSYLAVSSFLSVSLPNASTTIERPIKIKNTQLTIR